MGYLGTRSHYVYYTDNGRAYVIFTQDYFATVPGTGLVLYDSRRHGLLTSLPRLVTPRTVHWESVATPYVHYKRIPCARSTSALYSQLQRRSVQVAGKAGFVVGRTAERVSS